MQQNFPETVRADSARTEKSQRYFIFFSIIISLSLSIFVAEWVLRYQRQTFEQSIKQSESMEPGMILYDAQLGWKLKPYWSGKHHHYDYDVSYNIDSNGFRSSDKKLTVKKYTIIGDSFSFGLGVNDEETFSALLNANNPGYSFQNYSVPGYSTDQQLLLIKSLSRQDDRRLILVVYLGNDIFDNMRPYPLQAEHGKPYFSLADNRLALKNTPVPLKPKPAVTGRDSIASIVLGKENGASSALNWLSMLEVSRRLNLFENEIKLTDEDMRERFSDSLELFYALVLEINKIVKQGDGELSVVLLTGRSYSEQPSSLSAQYQEYFRKEIRTRLVESPSIKVIDLAKYLQRLTDDGIQKLYYPNEGHLTATGHRYASEFLAQQLTVQSTKQSTEPLLP